MKTVYSWYKNILKINKKEAFIHAHAVHHSYGRGTLPDLIDKCRSFDDSIVQREPDNNLLASLLLPYFLGIRPSDEITCDILSLVVAMTIVTIIIVAAMVAITIRMVVIGGNTMDNSFLYTKTLLLVDDEPDLLKMVFDILKDAGFQKILTATTGKNGYCSRVG